MSINVRNTKPVFNLAGEATASTYVNKKDSDKQQQTPAPTPVIRDAIHYDQLNA